MIAVLNALTWFGLGALGLFGLRLWLTATTANAQVLADVRKQVDTALGRLQDVTSAGRDDVKALADRVARLEAKAGWGGR